jgi:uncharacterized membrane protein
MNWLQRYRVRHYVRNSIWILPALGMVAALAFIRLLFWIDQMLQWESGFQPDSARALLSTLASSVFTLVVFVSSTLLLALQLASSNLTPRIIAILRR